MNTPFTPATPSNPVVAVQGLTKTFKDFWLRTRAKAVDNLTFHVEPGEIFGLLGPNGSGKSTTIKIILGLLRQTAGRVAVFGKPPTDVTIKRRIGYLPEESYLYPFLNARETLDYYGKLFQLDRRTRLRRIDELLDMVGLTAVQFRAVREYSKGMQRRIGIAQALINDPELLILDEPTTGLDPLGTRQVKDLVQQLGRRGKSIILCSHLLQDVEDCVDRVIILYGGAIRREGTCESLLAASAGSVIETDDLDDATVAELDRVIRARSGGAKSIAKVSRPRQRLEDLFVRIVDEARAKNVSTSGAQSGGQTAAFLREQEGAGLIDKLLTAEPAPSVAPPAAPVSSAPTGPDRAVLGDLLSEKAAVGGGGSGGGGRAEAAKPATPEPKQEVDQSVIGSLLDGGANGAGGGEKRG
jgi:ABC-2 type transport system ATP-binding protein